MAGRTSRRRAITGLAALTSVPIVGCQSGGLEARRDRAEAEGELERPPIRRIRTVAMREGSGAVVQRLFPTQYLKHLDPFVLLDDFDVRPPAGFPRHPHRGFEAFTYMRQGVFHHKDNLGNDSAIGAGGTQRFTSGRGAFHSEMPGTGGPNRGLQLWVNLPRRLKKMAPSYAGLGPESHPLDEEPDRTVRTVVGEGSGVELQTDVRYLDVALSPGAVFDPVIESGHNALVYVLEGAVRAAGELLEQHEAILPRPGRVRVAAQGAARVVLLAGKPHGEPILHRGPFVD